MKKLIAVLLTVLPAVAFGCKKLPADLPKLYPTQVTLTANGSPFSDAIVRLCDANSDSAKWVYSGTTDASGVAVIRANGLYDGCAAGAYKVTVDKWVSDPNWQPSPDDEFGEEREMLIPAVADRFMLASQSPLECTVAEGSNSFTFEVESVEIK